MMRIATLGAEMRNARPSVAQGQCAFGGMQIVHLPEMSLSQHLLGGAQSLMTLLTQLQICLDPRSNPSTERSKQGPQVGSLVQGQMQIRLPPMVG
jgi:hypothetical protein